MKHLDGYLDELEFRFNNRNNPYLFRDALLRLIAARGNGEGVLRFRILGSGSAIRITVHEDLRVRERIVVVRRPLAQRDVEIAACAGVGVATVYRHFPQRSDLIAAVFRREVDACASAATTLARDHEPVEALARWLRRYTSFVATKRGLAAALHSGDPAYEGLPQYFKEQLVPALQALLDAAVDAGQVRGGVEPSELLRAVGSLSTASGAEGVQESRRMVDLLIDGLRYGVGPNTPRRAR